jgi:hypothetical protein
VTLNLLGDFANPWHDGGVERARIQAGKKWSPGTIDWRAVFAGAPGATGVVRSTRNFLGYVKEQRPHSIERINLMTHSNTSAISFAGRIDPASGWVVLDVDREHALDRTLAELDPIVTTDRVVTKGTEPAPVHQTNTLGREARLLRDRFASGARLYVYSCNSGVDLELLDVIADAFQIEVAGLRSEIFTFVEFQTTGAPGLQRGLTSMLNDYKTSQRGFRHLDGSFIVRKPRHD